MYTLYMGQSQNHNSHKVVTSRYMQQQESILTLGSSILQRYMHTCKINREMVHPPACLNNKDLMGHLQQFTHTIHVQIIKVWVRLCSHFYITVMYKSSNVVHCLTTFTYSHMQQVMVVSKYSQYSQCTCMYMTFIHLASQLYIMLPHSDRNT